ncbi:ATP-binding protein [Thalassotalea hakodatensis]|uniref:ATP-binding protein n=1 Tax=Thalassotalea hakodatensis TaxID=3030492 RepID=UPI002572D204|nr:ATP-binding protein [Thalassotalea hakodatensis]
MNRLFIHLFLVIVLGLVTINWLTESLWQQWYPQGNVENPPLVRSLSVIVEQQALQPLPLSSLSTLLNMPVSMLSLQEVAWLPQQLKQLNAHRPVVTYDAFDQLIVYVKEQRSQQVYMFGPIKVSAMEPEHNTLKIVLLCLSYLLLALIIYLWSKPLWQDLNRLNAMTAQIAKGNFAITGLKSKSSPISNIVKTFHTMAQRVTQLVSDQRQLVNAVSHELRTPLARLRFSLEMLEQVPEQHRTEMKQDVTEMSTLIDEMLNYARLEKIDASDSKQQNDLVLIVNQVVDKGIRLSDKQIQCYLPTHCKYFCNEVLIERALQNLLSNAIRYAKQQVIVSLTQHEDNIQLIVEDDGCGIPSEERDKVFDAFYRIDKSRNKALGGFGLGLAIVERICRSHRGYCQVNESSLGGSKFIISLPQQ